MIRVRHVTLDSASVCMHFNFTFYKFNVWLNFGAQVSRKLVELIPSTIGIDPDSVPSTLELWDSDS